VLEGGDQWERAVEADGIYNDVAVEYGEALGLLFHILPSVCVVIRFHLLGKTGFIYKFDVRSNGSTISSYTACSSVTF
jgi:hypothetical protein